MKQSLGKLDGNDVLIESDNFRWVGIYPMLKDMVAERKLLIQWKAPRNGLVELNSTAATVTDITNDDGDCVIHFSPVLKKDPPEGMEMLKLNVVGMGAQRAFETHTATPDLIICLYFSWGGPE